MQRGREPGRFSGRWCRLPVAHTSGVRLEPSVGSCEGRIFGLKGGDCGMERLQGARSTHKLNHQQREALAAVVESGPDPAIHGVVRWRHGSRRPSVCLWRRPPWERSCAPWAMPSSPPARATTPRTQLSGRCSKQLSRPSRRDPHQAGRWRRSGDPVAGGGGHRAEKQDHRPLGKARRPSGSSQGSEDHLSLSLRRRLPQEGEGGRSGNDLCQHRSNKRPSG